MAAAVSVGAGSVTAVGGGGTSIAGGGGGDETTEVDVDNDEEDDASDDAGTRRIATITTVAIKPNATHPAIAIIATRGIALDDGRPRTRTVGVAAPLGALGIWTVFRTVS